MAEGRSTSNNEYSTAAAAAVAAAIVFVFWHVIVNLTAQWWDDENYSHGLLVPFVIGYIIWLERTRLLALASPAVVAGIGLSILSALMLIGGVLAAELFTQRVAFVAMLAAVVLYFGGRRVLGLLSFPFALLLLSIPIPQIAFNRVAFPLQIWASQLSVWLIRMIEIPVTRKGNVIDILPRGATQTISLEVVEACSGIRSLMTLMALAVIIGYITRRSDRGWFGVSRGDVLRTAILAVAAIPIAVITNAVRVAFTGVLTYQYGKQAVEGVWHDSSGWLVYLVALALLFGLKFLLRKLIPTFANKYAEPKPPAVMRSASILPIIAILVFTGIFATWLTVRSENLPDRPPLSGVSSVLGDWKQRGSEIKFETATEGVLRATDYTMREYIAPDGRISNIYVGYYDSQRTGATYHSPQNCLPGAGWILSEPERIELIRSDGQRFEANRYIIENGVYREVMVYWYQGRGRIEASEYRDKLNTVIDSVMRNRTDGAMIRVMTAAGRNNDENAFNAASDLAVKLADELPAFIPD